jgi:hypothetical protein
VTFPGCAAKAALELILEKGPTDGWIIGSNDETTFTKRRDGMSELKSRVAPVTGGSRGIGKAVAVNLRERTEDAEAVVEAIQKNNGRAAVLSRLTSRFASLVR